MNFLKLARFAVKDNIEYQRSLGTIGPRLMSLSGWMRQARQFYENAINNDDIMQLLSRFSITKEKLQEGLDLLPEIEALDNEQESKKGLAIKSTRERDEAFDKLNAYMTEFRTVCRIAFEDEPQTLERLGIPVGTSNYKRRDNNLDNDTEPDNTGNNLAE